MKKIMTFAIALFALASCAKVENLALEDYEWKLAEMEGITAEEIGEDEAFVVRFDKAESMASGQTNCNSFFGEYTLNGENLTFDAMGVTRKMCPDMNAEDAFLAMLKRVDGFKIEGDKLTLMNKGKAMAAFKMFKKAEFQKETPVEAAAQEQAPAEEETAEEEAAAEVETK